MTKAQIDEPIGQKPLLLWPGVAIVVLQWLVRFGVPVVLPEATAFGIFGGLLGWLMIVVWWLFFSRALRLERWGAVALMLIALAATPLILHRSIATAMRGLIFVFYATPVMSLAFVLWAIASPRLADGPRRAALVVTMLLASGVWAFLRMEGMGFGGGAQFAWRWSETSEERFLAGAVDEEIALPSNPETMASRAAWPGFLGRNRDGIITGVWIETDWSASPPVELWRRPVGPGWASFTANSDLLYTQEQHGEDEVIACYNLATGKPEWRHSDRTRFWEAIGGAGPRGTPTLSNGFVYTFGATGILNVLDGGDGSVIWSRNAASDAGAKLPYWGFASSPLLVDDAVIIAASGSLAAYDRATGEPRWFAPAGGVSYSSPHLLTIDGVTQILMLNGTGVTSVAPTDGARLWQHAWPGESILQPALTRAGDILVSVGQGSGIRRLAVRQGPDGWTTEERWTSARLKPYYSQFVVHQGHAFGFDGSILACIDLEDGKRKWKGGRYGAGQLLLLTEQDLLLVLSERGELALVSAASEKFKEIARVPGIDGKTWNHPVLVGDVLLVRNGQEMAAFRLSMVGGHL